MSRMFGVAGNSKLYFLAALVGFVAGLFAAAFHYSLDQLILFRGALHGGLEGSWLPGWLLMTVAGALLVCLSLYLVRRYAPETAGSGIPQVELALGGTDRLRWRRVLPVKFIASIIAMAPGLVLGREGPTIHIGAACGQMIAEKARLGSHQLKTLLAAGAAAGLGAAFNAPLAGIMLVTEEMRQEFEYNFVSLQSIILASCVAVVVSEWWLGQGPQLEVAALPLAPLAELPLFLLLGVVVGAFGVLFNRCLMLSLGGARLRAGHLYLAAAAVGVILGNLMWFFPAAAGGGEAVLSQVLNQPWTLILLLQLLFVRTIASLASYGTGVPGGIFAPLLALGTLLGVTFSFLVSAVLPGLDSSAGMFAVAAMGALFAATVRAPLTGIVLVVELTGAYGSLLTIILTCLMATFTAQFLNGKPIYHELRQRLARQWP